MFDHASVRESYFRCLNKVGTDDPYGDDMRLGIHDVLKAHHLIADHFMDSDRGLADVGPRDFNLLHSALFRQHTGFEGVYKYQTRFDIMASLFFGLVKDHPFIDANKRTAFLVLLYHLRKLKLVPTISQSELENFTVDVADGALVKKRRYERYAQESDDPAEKYISRYLRKNTRELDSKHYDITFRKLKSVLNSFGFEMQHPQNNRIDIIRIEERRTLFNTFGPKEKVNVRVCSIGFPGWTKQVSKGDIKTVRKATKLDADHGVDSQTFFKGLDPIDCLIAEYSEPLRRLADR